MHASHSEQSEMLGTWLHHVATPTQLELNFGKIQATTHCTSSHVRIVFGQYAALMTTKADCIVLTIILTVLPSNALLHGLCTAHLNCTK